MIDLAAELLNETGNQIEHHEAEIARLQQLRASLEAFIDSPDQGSLAVAPTVSVGSPAPVSAGAVRSGAASAPAPAAVPLPPGDGSPATTPLVECPQCGEKVKAQGLGSHQRKHKDGYVPPARPTPAGAMAVCPECSAEVKAMGLGTHRRQKHGRGRPTVLVRPPAPQERPATERNPRSTPPLDLPRRLDQAVGE